MTPSAKLDALITETKARGARSIYIHLDNAATQRSVADFCADRIRAAGLLAIYGGHVIGSEVPPIFDAHYGETVNLRDGNWPDQNARRRAVINTLRLLTLSTDATPYCLWWFGFDACSDTALKDWLAATLSKVPTPEHIPGYVAPVDPTTPVVLDEKPTHVTTDHGHSGIGNRESGKAPAIAAASVGIGAFVAWLIRKFKKGKSA